jgi:signal transduction histidine kinase
MSLLGLLIVLRNARSVTYLLFGLLTFISIAWFTTIYFSNRIFGYDISLFVNKLSLFVGFLLILAIWLMSLYFPVRIRKHRIQRVVAVVVTPILLLITLFSDSVVNNVEYNPFTKVTEITTGNLYNFYIFIAVLFFIFIAFNYLKSYRSKTTSNLQKQKIIYVSIGSVSAFVWSKLTEAVIPSLTHNWTLSRFGAVGSWFLIIAVSYAILRHKLFDIRLIIARSIAYVLSLATVALLLIVPALILISYLLDVHLDKTSIAILILATLIVAIAFQPIHYKFNKITNRLFYRDYYEPQEVLSRLTNSLVGSVEVNHIVDYSSKILTNTLKPQFLDFILFFSKEQKQKNQELLLLLDKFKKDIVSIDTEQSTESELYDKMREQNISVAVRLRTSKEELGYMLLGYKQSGLIYDDVDKRLLSIAADEIAISLQNAFRFEEIKNFNKTLEQKISEATEQLHKANNRLKMLDETKDDFISLASHQLRTPLSIIKGYVNMVIQGDAGKINEKQKDFLELALASSENMVTLVTELLNVSRITSGKFSVDVSPVNLADIVDTEVKKLTNMADQRKVSLTFVKPKEFPTVLIDEEKTRQVIGNFIDNAIYYSRDKDAKIDVQLTCADNIVFKVVDNGIGVSEKEKGHLFTKFYRAKNAKDVRPNGTGVGLYLAKVVISEQGGDLIFESKEGQGSTFGFKFKKDKIIQASPKP